MATASADAQAERYKSQGNEALAGRDFHEAVRLYSLAIAQDPNCATFFSNRSAAYASLERWREALDDAQEAARMRPEWAKAHVRRGSALSALGRHTDARNAYARAKELEPSNTQYEAYMRAEAEAAKKEEEKDWEGDLWSDDEEAEEQPAATDAGAGGKRAAADSGSGGGGGGGGGGVKRRKCGGRTARQLDLAIADASAGSLRACMAQLGKSDEDLANRIISMLEGLNAASSAGEDDSADGGDDSD